MAERFNQGCFYKISWKTPFTEGWVLGEYLCKREHDSPQWVFLCLSWDVQKYDTSVTPGEESGEKCLVLTHERNKPIELVLFTPFFKQPVTKGTYGVEEVTFDDFPLYMDNATPRLRELLRGI